MNIHKHALTYAAAIIITSIAVRILTYVLGLPEWTNIASFPVNIAITCFAIRNWRIQGMGGYISYGRSFGFLTLLSIYVLVPLSVWTYSFYTYIAPELYQKMIYDNHVQTEKMLKSMHMSDEQISDAITMGHKWENPGITAIGVLVGGMILFTIINLIIAAIFKKDDPRLDTFESNSGTI